MKTDYKFDILGIMIAALGVFLSLIKSPLWIFATLTGIVFVGIGTGMWCHRMKKTYRSLW